MTVALSLLAGAPQTFAQGTAFTYQGRLSDNGAPANGNYGMVFYLCDTADIGGQLANLGIVNVPVSNGLFNVMLDFGANFPGEDRWLEITVKTNGAATFTTLSPRQKLLPTPYAIHAGNATLLSGLGTNALAPATGSSSYVAKAGDTMTGPLNLPANRLVVGNNQLIAVGGNVGIGTGSPENKLHIASGWVQLNRGYGAGSDFATVGGWYRPNLGLALPHSSEYGSLNFLAHPSGFAPNIAFRSSLDNSAWMVVSGGNVGIGTTSPTAKFEVAGGKAVIAGSNKGAIDSALFGSPSTGVFWDMLTQRSGGLAGLGIIETDGVDSPVIWMYNNPGNAFHVKNVPPTDTRNPATEGQTLFMVRSDGNVGIGTTSPGDFKLSVAGSTRLGGLMTVGRSGSHYDEIGYNVGFTATDNAYTYVSGDSAASIRLGYAGGSVGGIEFRTAPVGNAGDPLVLQNRMMITAAGNVGIGTASPQRTLSVNGSMEGTQGRFGELTSVANHRALTAYYDNSYGNGTDGAGVLQAVRIGVGYTPIVMNPQGGNVGIGTTTPSAKLEVNGSLKVTGAGNSVTTPVLTITGGSDVAEPFQMSESDIPKGAVVVIDEENAGRLKMSERAYDSRVAGIVSGAGGVQPGITLSQQGVLEGGQHVALSGRVYVQADTSDTPIQPGDLLTTSDVPGHAMKVRNHAQAQGAILGKAVSRLEAGHGLVLVLVTLQ